MASEEGREEGRGGKRRRGEGRRREERRKREEERRGRKGEEVLRNVFREQLGVNKTTEPAPLSLRLPGGEYVPQPE